MADAASTAVAVLLIVLILILIGALVVLAAWLTRQVRRRRAYDRAGISHLDLYFDKHFPDIVRNFDLVTGSRFASWSTAINARLGGLTRDLDTLGTARQGLDARLERLEKRLTDIE